MIAKTPWIIVWLDWNLYAYWPSLVTSIIAVGFHRMYYMQKWGITQNNLSDISLVLFVGVSAWVVYCAVVYCAVVYCAVRYGYAVG
jgi:dolichyl-phosphate-mannose--protein O-mannosyl transferase